MEQGGKQLGEHLPTIPGPRLLVYSPGLPIPVLIPPSKKKRKKQKTFEKWGSKGGRGPP